MRDALGVPLGICDRDRGSLRGAEQRKAIEAGGIDDGLEVGHPGVDGQIAELAIRETAPALVVAEARVAGSERIEPVPPHRALPVEVQVRQPGRHPHDRRPAAVQGVGQPHAIHSGAESDLLLHGPDPSDREHDWWPELGAAGSSLHTRASNALVSPAHEALAPCTAWRSDVRVPGICERSHE